jgi:phosphate:Na+ symporter
LRDLDYIAVRISEVAERLADPSQPVYLDEAAIEFPSIALGYAAREALRMVDVLDSMIEGAANAFRRPDRGEIARSRRLDDVLDALNGEIKHYVMRLDPERLSDEERRRLEGILAFSLNLESGGDVIERNILPFAAKQMRRGVELSHEAEREIEAVFQAARSNLGAAASIFMTGDPRAARALTEQKSEFRRREADAIRAHLAHLRKDDTIWSRAPPIRCWRRAAPCWRAGFGRIVLRF